MMELAALALKLSVYGLRAHAHNLVAESTFDEYKAMRKNGNNGTKTYLRESPFAAKAAWFQGFFCYLR